LSSQSLSDCRNQDNTENNISQLGSRLEIGVMHSALKCFAVKIIASRNSCLVILLFPSFAETAMGCAIALTDTADARTIQFTL
jgi:hypothetical protein